MPKVTLEQIVGRWVVFLLVATAVVAQAGDVAAQWTARSSGGSGALLPLVTERLERPGQEEPEVRYWWKRATQPQWTETDRVLRAALRETSARLLTPSGDVRISRIYRTPELSIDNASALASILGARRIVVGEVTYSIRESTGLPGGRGVHAEATLQLVDAGSSEPSVVRTISLKRSVYQKQREPSLLAAARQEVGREAGKLLGRTLATASGPVGVESAEEYLAFHDVERGEALNRIRRFLGQLDIVEDVRVRWASEGVVTLEVNPGQRDDADTVAYAARTLVNHKFDRMSVSRRQKSLGGRLMEFSVRLADGFGEKRQESEEDGRGRD